MEAILTHEMTHQRRHDNLSATIHMLVEALFWFHPMVWWMERRMVEERERACDEAVVRLGSSPEAYAEGLLKACRFCVEAPLACVSGITGAELSRRVRAIMALHLGRQLGLKEKLLLALAAAMAIAGPVTFGVVRAAQTSPNQLTAVPERQAAQDIEGSWRSTVKGQTDARKIPAPPPPPNLMPADADPSFEVATIKPNDSARIADRFQRKLHNDTRDMSAFVLTVDTGGAKIAHTQFNGPLPNLGLQPATGDLTFMKINGTMQDFPSYVLNRPVVVDARLQGKFDFTLTFLPNETQLNGPSPVGKLADGVKPTPTLFETLH